MSARRPLSVMASVLALIVLVAGCAGLPTSGDVNAGLAIGDGDAPVVTEVAAGPISGASPEDIVAGFMDAAITSTDGWAIARQFMDSDLADSWRPSAGVTIDSTASERIMSSDVDSEGAGSDGSAAVEGTVRVQVNQVARLDEDGTYTQLSGDAAVVTFMVKRNADGEWRITGADDGLVLDAEAFAQVFEQHALQYFDTTYSYLIPDVRWYARRATLPTTLTQALVDGAPSAWMAQSAVSAFPSDVSLEREAVLVTGNTAEVELTTPALGLDATTLAQMRVQLERTLVDTGVTEVRFTVNGRDLNAGRAAVAAPASDAGPLVMTKDGFGELIGDEVVPIDRVSDQLVMLAGTLLSVEVAADNSQAAIQQTDDKVFLVGDTGVVELDTRSGLIRPTLDPYGYTWTVPATQPSALLAWEPSVTSSPIANAFPDASAISFLRVSPDGARVAAIVTVGSQQWIVVAAVLRDDDQAPVGLGTALQVAQLSAAPLAMSWVGGDSLRILAESGNGRIVVAQDIGGPTVVTAAPTTAIGLVGGSTAAGLRVLGSDGRLYAQRGTTWQEARTGIVLLAVRSGE